MKYAPAREFTEDEIELIREARSYKPPKSWDWIAGKLRSNTRAVRLAVDPDYAVKLSNWEADRALRGGLEKRGSRSGRNHEAALIEIWHPSPPPDPVEVPPVEAAEVRRLHDKGMTFTALQAKFNLRRADLERILGPIKC